MKKTVCIIGGDDRNFELGYLLKKHDIVVKNNINEYKDIDEFLKDADCVVCGIPFTRDDKTINAVNILEKINIEEVFKSMKFSKKLIAGSISNKIKELSNKYGIELYDFLDDEDFAIYNAIPTAEGAIEVAIRETRSTIHSSNCLILGYGRIGKVLADMLKGLHANVTVAARKDIDYAWIKAMGYQYIKYSELEKILPDVDILFNTVPSVVLNKNELSYLKKDSLIVELASKPGGVDFEAANELGLKTEVALGLPGKVAPKSVAEYMLNKVIKVI